MAKIKRRLAATSEHKSFYFKHTYLVPTSQVRVVRFSVSYAASSASAGPQLQAL